MALSATFAADFSAFTTACDQAVISLKGIETGAGNVESKLTRMGDSLSGTALIQKATLMVEAVERVGGASTLTYQELQRIGTTAEEAAEKLRKLGQDVPPGIQHIADAAIAARQELKATTTEGTGGFGTLLTSVKDVATALGIAFGAGAVISGIKNLIGDAIEMASAIGDASDKLGVSAEKFQGWVAAAQTAGSNADAVSTAIAHMNIALAGGSDSTVAALKAAGLEFQAIRDMKSEDAFEAIVTAVMHIKDPMERARVEAELFKDRTGELLPAIMGDMVKVGEGATKMSDETVRQLKLAGDAWTTLKNQVTIVTGSTIAAVATTVTETTSSWKSLGMFLTEAAAGGVTYALNQQAVRRAVQDTKGAVDKLVPSLADLKEQAHRTAQQIKDEEEAHRKAEAAVKAHKDAINALVDDLTGKKTEQHLRDLAEAVNLAGKKGGLAAVEEEKLATELTKLYTEGIKLPPVLEDIVLKHLDLRDAVKEVKTGLEGVVKYLPNVTTAWQDEARDSMEALGLINSAIDRHIVKLDGPGGIQSVIKDTTNLWPEMKDTSGRAIDDMIRKHQEMVDKVSAATVTLLDAGIRGWDDFKAALNQIWKDILHDFEEELIKKMVAKWLAGLAEMAAGSAAGGGFWAGLLNFLGLGGGGKGSGAPGEQPPQAPLPGTGEPPPESAYPPDFIGPIPPPPVIGVPAPVPPSLTDPGAGHPTPKPVSRGGRVISGGIDYLEAGGVVWPWQPQGSDTVPAMLTPGERVLSVADAKRYDAGLLAGRGRGRGGTVIIELNGRFLAQAVVPELEGEIRRLGFGR